MTNVFMFSQLSLFSSLQICFFLGALSLSPLNTRTHCLKMGTHWGCANTCFALAITSTNTCAQVLTDTSNWYLLWRDMSLYKINGFISYCKESHVIWTGMQCDFLHHSCVNPGWSHYDKAWDSDRNRTVFLFISHAILCSGIWAHSLCMSSNHTAKYCF